MTDGEQSICATLHEFGSALDYFKTKLENREPFALSRFGDGELKMLRSSASFGNQHYNYNKGDDVEFMRDALQFKHDLHYVGISCSCCWGEGHKATVDMSGQLQERLTFANIFSNANYVRFLEEYLPVLAGIDHIMFVHSERADLSGLPFTGVSMQIPSYNAWREFEEIRDKLVKHVRYTRGWLYLFAAGPMSGALVAAALRENPDNTYLDIGAVIDPLMGLGDTHGYHQGKSTLTKVCRWGG